MDPYKVLGVTPQTSDDDIKRAYRELARKFHPDNYVGNPLADLAEKRMKEINEAYDMIMSERNSKNSNYASGNNNSSSSYGANSNNGNSSGYQQGGYNVIYTQVRDAINKGNLALAEELLNREPSQSAEWNYLKGTIYFRKGWYDEARIYYMKACEMEPNNSEYRNALNMLNMGAGYGGYRPMTSMSICDCCTTMLCMNCCCNSCCGGGC